MRFAEGRKAPGASGTGMDIFKDFQTGPKFSNSQNLFTGDGSNGELRSTAQRDYSIAYEPGFKGDFYFTYQWHEISEYGIFCLVLDNLSGFNPVQNSGGLYKRAIRNDRDQFYVNHEKVFGDNAFSGYKSGTRTMVWYRVEGKTFVECKGCNKRLDITKYVGTKTVFPIFSHHNGPRVTQNLYVTSMKYSETLNTGPEPTGVNPASGVFKDFEVGPAFDNGPGLFAYDSDAGSIRSTAQKDYSIATQKALNGDFYFEYHWNGQNDYGIAALVLSDLKGFDPKQNTGGLTSRAIRNDRDEVTVFGKTEFGDKVFADYRQGAGVMQWYRVNGRTFINCEGCLKRIEVTKWVGLKPVYMIFSHHNGANIHQNIWVNNMQLSQKTVDRMKAIDTSDLSESEDSAPKGPVSVFHPLKSIKISGITSAVTAIVYGHNFGSAKTPVDNIRIYVSRNGNGVFVKAKATMSAGHWGLSSKNDAYLGTVHFESPVDTTQLDIKIELLGQKAKKQHFVINGVVLSY